MTSEEYDRERQLEVEHFIRDRRRYYEQRIRRAQDEIAWCQARLGLINEKASIGCD